jgi:hypothetical protein
MLMWTHRLFFINSFCTLNFSLGNLIIIKGQLFFYFLSKYRLEKKTQKSLGIVTQHVYELFI